jgi:hypothetical protein
VVLAGTATGATPAQQRTVDIERVIAASPRYEQPREVNDRLGELRGRVFAAAWDADVSPPELDSLRELVAAVPRPDHVLLLQHEAERIVVEAGGRDLKRASVEVQEQLALISRELETHAAQAELLRVIEAFFEPREAGGPDWSQLRRGDLLFIRHVNQPIQAFLWAMRFSHCGNYDGDGWVYEAVIGQGVIRRRLDEWKTFEGTIALARNTTSPASEIERALDRAKGQYGSDGRTPYNLWFLDKETEDRLYCSQLSWKIHKAARIDLDSNDGRYLLWMSAKWGSWITRFVGVPAVAPDEVALSPHVRVYSEGPAHP